MNYSRLQLRVINETPYLFVNPISVLFQVLMILEQMVVCGEIVETSPVNALDYVMLLDDLDSRF